MTVSTTNNKNVYNGNDVSTIFAYVFKIFNNTELTVIKTFTDGTESVLVLDADYSVSGAGSDAGGTITYPISGDPLATGEIIVIKRVLPETQTTDLRNQGAWNPEVVEDEFDKSRMIDLQQQESINRSLKTPESELTVIGTLPTVDQRAQKVLSFDDNGDPVKSNGGAGNGVLLSVAELEAAVGAAGENGFLPITVEFIGTGAQSTFDLTFTPISSAAILVWIDDVIQQPVSDYSVTDQNIIFVAPPPNLANIVVRNFGVAIQADIDTFVGNNILTNFTLSFFPDSADTLLVWINDVIQEVDNDYTVASDEISFVIPPPNLANIVVRNFSSNFANIGTNNDAKYGLVVDTAPSSLPDDIKASLPVAPPDGEDGTQVVIVLTHTGNITTTPNFTLNNWTPRQVVKLGINAGSSGLMALNIKDFSGIGAAHHLIFNATENKWVLINTGNITKINITPYNISTTGTVNALILSGITPPITFLRSGEQIKAKSLGLNTINAPTINFGAGLITITARGCQPLELGDLGPAGYPLDLTYYPSGPCMELANPYLNKSDQFLPGALPYSVIQNISTGGRFLGLPSGPTGPIQELSSSQAKAILGGGSSFVKQGDLDTSSGQVSGVGVHLLPGGQYGFYPETTSTALSIDLSVGATISGILGGRQAVGSGVWETSILLTNSGGVLPGTPGARQRYINASPPYDLGDGEIPLFVFVHVGANGHVLKSYVADCPPWVYNGTTDVMPHRIGANGKKYRTRKIIDREGDDWFERYMDGDQEEEEYEITDEIQNADIALIPHPYPSLRPSYNPDDPEGHPVPQEQGTVVLLDPCCTEKLLTLHNDGEDIHSLLVSSKLKISNTFLTRAVKLTSQSDVKIISVDWARS